MRAQNVPQNSQTQLQWACLCVCIHNKRADAARAATAATTTTTITTHTHRHTHTQQHNCKLNWYSYIINLNCLLYLYICLFPRVCVYRCVCSTAQRFVANASWQQQLLCVAVFHNFPTKPTVNELKFSCKLAAQQPLLSARKPHRERRSARCALPMFLFVYAIRNKRRARERRREQRAKRARETHALFLGAAFGSCSYLSLLLLLPRLLLMLRGCFLLSILLM